KLAHDIRAKESLLVFANVPSLAMDAMLESSATGAFPALGGKMAEQVSALRDILTRTRKAVPAIAAVLEQMELQIQILASRKDEITTQKDINDLQTVSATLDRVADCAAKTAEASAPDPGAGARTAAAAVSCVNDVIQVVLTGIIGEKKNQAEDDEEN